MLCQAGLWLLPLLALARFGLLRRGGDLSRPGAVAIAATLALGIAFVLGYLKRPSRLESAVLLDERIGAQGAVAALFELRQKDDSGYLELLGQKAAAHLSDVRLDRALPWPRPPALGPFSLLVLAFACALAIRPSPRPEALLKPGPAATESGPSPLALPEEELSLLARRAERLLSAATSQEGRQRAQEYADLVERLKKGTLDQKQALSAVAALEREIQEQSNADGNPDRGATDRANTKTPEAGEKTGRASEDEADALRRLAERLAQETAPPTERELDQIRKSLEQAREQNQKEHEAARAETEKTEQRLRDKERRLLAKKDAGNLTKGEEAELDQTKRQLERLDRQKNQEAEEASELDRQLAEALRELQGDQQKASEFLDKAADAASQSDSRKLTDAEKRELLDQLRALKERLRQGEQQDKSEQLRQFERRAQGRGQQEGQGEGQGKPGGVSLVPRSGSGTGQPGAPGSPGEGSAEVQAGTGMSTEPGKSHDPSWQGEATPGLDAKVENKAAAARDTGEGSSESETILTAAEEGFRAGDYERLYKDYQTVLEEMVRGETIPRARRTEVERYFDLIRPRSD